MQKLICLTVLCFGFICKPALAVMPVEVQSKTPDMVGQRLVFAFKEGIRSSASLGISFDESTPRMQVSVVTLDQNPSMPGYSTVYSVVILWNNPAQVLPYYLQQYVGYC